ncbi:hypothetical protein KA012_04010 [Candidatus Woesebacteria bacterium]|nr:hypothetical protein [Candidatus Woesebacteria bacterium]
MNSSTPLLSFAESIELGKYDQEYLSQYQEWRELDRQLKFQFISKAIKKRRLQLRLQWANLANQPNFSKKPHLLDAQKKVEQALSDLEKDEEVLMVEYAGC